MSTADKSATEVVKPAPTVFPERTQFDLSSYPCPRCEKTMAADSYAPCQDCIAELKASQQGEAAQVVLEPSCWRRCCWCRDCLNGSGSSAGHGRCRF